jgi:hypothetical protein
MRRRPSKPQPKPVPLSVQALAEIKRAELDDLPYGVRGELAAPRPAEPPRLAPEPLRIEPPPWAGKEAEPGEPVDPPEPLPHAAMFSGYFDPPPPSSLGPHERVEPLTRPMFPAPDWRAEEQERARRAAAAKREAELEPEHERCPAKKKKTSRVWRTS